MFEASDSHESEEKLKKTPEVAEVAEANNKFGLNLYDHVKKEKQRSTKKLSKVYLFANCFVC